MEDDLHFKVNGRQPQFQGKWKTTSISRQMEDNLNLLAKASPEVGTAQTQLVLLIRFPSGASFDNTNLEHEANCFQKYLNI
jgi:hypothetical protein